MTITWWYAVKSLNGKWSASVDAGQTWKDLVAASESEAIAKASEIYQMPDDAWEIYAEVDGKLKLMAGDDA